MQKTISLSLLPTEAANDTIVREYIAASAGTKTTAITGYLILKRSIDARGKQPHVQLTLKTYINEPAAERELMHVDLEDVATATRRVVIIGAGPAGLFGTVKVERV